MGASAAGKGSEYRPVNRQLWDKNYDNIKRCFHCKRMLTKEEVSEGLCIKCRSDSDQDKKEIIK